MPAGRCQNYSEGYDEIMNLKKLDAPDDIEEEAEHLRVRRGLSQDAARTLGQELMSALAENSIVRAIGLMEDGADPRVRDADDQPALCVAFSRGDAAMARILLSYGADPAAVDGGGRDVVALAARSGDVDSLMLALGLERAPGIFGRDNSKQTPLMHACMFAKPECARILLAAGSDPNATNGWGITTLMVAATGGHPECVRMLIDVGADVEALDQQGRGVAGRCKTESQHEVEAALSVALSAVRERRELEEAVDSGRRGKARSGWL